MPAVSAFSRWLSVFRHAALALTLSTPSLGAQQLHTTEQSGRGRKRYLESRAVCL